MPRSRSSETKPPPARSTARPRPVRAPPSGPDVFLVVGIGASAGGLDASAKLMDALPAGTGMAFILVQHLDPAHESMMADLLAGHTSMIVRQAADGMPIERDHLYIIPPGTYLAVGDGALHLSEPQARHGARLPFDFLLGSLADAYAEHAACVVLSGTGADGSNGLKAVKERGGLVIAQDPDEAEYDGMPRNAIMTGAVDLVLPVAKIPDALTQYGRRAASARTRTVSRSRATVEHRLNEIIDLLRAKTAHDFRLYKPGTLQRRIERRMAMTAIEAGDPNRYLAILRSDPRELNLLAKDLLINVTGFFRDRRVFDLLAERVIPDLIGKHPVEQPLRVWIAGCSTGEETYSLAMLFREQITAAQRNIKLQVFASDVDPDAVANARDGLYPKTIETEVSPERLARFFTKEDRGYRVLPELRASVVFTTHDVLTDPPFSRLDFVSCRNLLIYLRPEAQAKVVSLFHFALREGGLLLLGSSETVVNAADRFELISKPGRLYRRIGRSRPGELSFSLNADGVRGSGPAGQDPAPSRQVALGELCRRLVMEAYAPAAVLIDRKHACLYSMGPADRYLQVPAGAPTRDLLAMARPSIRTRLRSAIQQASQENARVVTPAGSRNPGDGAGSFSIVVQPVPNEGEDLLLICFIDEPAHARKQGHGTLEDASRVAELEQELEATKAELIGAVRDLELSSEEQRTVNDELLSVNEEYQSTNEELLTSKEELQSLNEELTALNSQLQETLERQRTTSNDLQNVLYSTGVATIFLDSDLNIRFFTPATKALFNVIPSDVGRPLAHLSSLAADGLLLTDAATVLRTLGPLEQEIETPNGVWYIRRISPYRTQDEAVEGVVITFADITERKRAADAMEAAKRDAQRANIAKSRFLAAASHDLRQPLQTLALVQGLLAKAVEGEAAQKLVALLDQTSAAMSGMLNTLLDINQIDAGTVSVETVDFPIDDVLRRLADEFTYHANAQGLALRTVPCSLSLRSDPRLLEQTIRNLLSNALKYTQQGRILLGCRRKGAALSIEVWDTGIGIPGSELQTIFEEYYQVDNEARERSRGLGLGLSIVRRLADLLGYRVRVESRLGKGSVFAVDVTLPTHATQAAADRQVGSEETETAHRAGGAVLIVEDDPEVRDLLDLLLKGQGHDTATAPDGIAALDLIARGDIQPDLILADYNLPNDMNGLQVAAKLRGILHRRIPVIILTGDISTDTLRAIALGDCVQLTKPVKAEDLIQIVQRVFPVAAAPTDMHAPPASEIADKSKSSAVVFVVDDDRLVREGIRAVLEADGRTVKDFATGEAFLAAYRPSGNACLLVDAYLPQMSGLELLQQLSHASHRLPAIMITGKSDVSITVEAMRAGALDFIEKPFAQEELRASVGRALEQSQDASTLFESREAAAARIATLTPRQRHIMDLVVAGQLSKNIAADLGISQRTVEHHRAAIMERTGVNSLPALIRLVLAATSNPGGRG